MLKSILEKVARPGVSDLHLKANEPPLVRRVGQLIPIGTTAVRPDDMDAIVNTLLNDAQKSRLADTGTVSFSHSVDGIGRLRVNAYRQKGTVALSIRIVANEPKTFDQLNLPRQTMERLTQNQRGLILIGGIAGSGKSTTLAALVTHINETYSYNIVTIEDPIEFLYPRKKSSVSQREVGRDVESVDRAVADVARQDPDVVVITELRNGPDFDAAISLAASHLVIASIYAVDAIDAIERIVNAFEGDHQAFVRTQLSNVLKAVIGVRLLPGRDKVAAILCSEFLFITPPAKKLLASNAMGEVRFQMEKGGALEMRTFDQELLRMTEAGLISADVAATNALNPNDLRLKLQGQAPPEASK